MLEWLRLLFDTSSFPRRWSCGSWSEELGWFHILSDLGVWSAYMAIPITLALFALKKNQLPFRSLFIYFTLFILACGATHLIDAIIFWKPIYRISGVAKFLTAVISWYTVIVLIRHLPLMFAMRTPEELEKEVQARQRAEVELKKTNAELERRVAERTAALSEANTTLHAERERFRATLASIADGVVAVDKQLKVTFLNKVAEMHTGWHISQAYGQPIQQVFTIRHEKNQSEIENPAIHACRTGTVQEQTNHTVLVGKDGHDRPIDYYAAPIRDEHGQVAGAVLVYRDVTTQRNLEALREQQAKLTALRADLSSLLALDLPLVEVIQKCCNVISRHLSVGSIAIWTAPDDSLMLKLMGSEGQAIKMQTITLPNDAFLIGRVAKLKILIISTEQNDFNQDLELDQKTNQSICQFIGYPLVVDGKLKGVLSIYLTELISHEEFVELEGSSQLIAQFIERREFQNEIAESEERYRLFFELNPLPMWLYDSETLQFLVVNAAAVKKYGYDYEEFKKIKLQQIRPEEDIPALLNVVSTVDGPSETSIWRHRTKQGEIMKVHVRTHNTSYKGKKARLVQAVDVTQQLKVEDELRASEARFRAFMDHSPVVGWITKKDGTLCYVSASFNRSFKVIQSELIGKPLASVLETTQPLDEFKTTDGMSAASTVAAANLFATRADGTAGEFLTYFFSLPGPDGEHQVGGVAVDVTELRATEAALRESENRLRQSQKLEAIGLLAGGIAHDFNNLLTVVSGCSELLALEMGENSAGRSLIDAIIQASDRGAKLTKQLLTFSRQQMLQMEVFQPATVIENLTDMLVRLLGEDIILRHSIDPQAGFIRADKGQFEQIIINLAVNSRDAMPRGGELLIQADAIDINESNLPSPEAKPGSYFRLTVTDQGEGMSEELISRLFEPFFTTKPQNQGTGLGLAVVYGIVKQVHGFITVQSEVGRGSTFSIHIPQHEPVQAVIESQLGRPNMKPCHERILIVEDDAAVRTIATSILTRQGYRVEQAENATAALAMIESQTEPPDLILTDVVMPGLSGRELAEKLHVKYPLLKVIFLSGYTSDTILRHGIEESNVWFLHKPYKSDQLIKFVREVLDK